MTQELYAHMNNKRKMKKKIFFCCPGVTFLIGVLSDLTMEEILPQ
jgi:hypothetical protein